MAAIMESFDAQMMDYHNDGDVQMHTTHETWFQEATMEDDGLQLHGETHSSSTEFEDVEIDMEENPTDSVQNPEYEMVDEDGGVDYPVGDVDEDDVIVHDISHSSEASAINIPEFNPPVNSSTSPFSQGHALPQQEPPLTLFDSSQLGGDSIDIADDHDTKETLDHADLPPSGPLQASAVDDIGGTSATNEAATEPSTDFAEVSPELAGSSTQTEQIEQGAEDSDDLSNTNEVEVPTVESSQLHTESAADQHHHTFSGAGGHEVPSNEEVIVGGFPEEGAEDSPDEGEVEAGAAPTQHDHNPETEFAQVDQNESVIEMTQKDSFELSEVTTLDPPPGVLLSFSHADHPEVCLFSQPNQPETSSAAGQSYKLVFEDNPSLYYEPLSALFDALRQSEFVTTSYDVSLSELTIDAFDLQLVISEDNIFSRETSIYDLHQLHDGSGFSGPLRLRLQSSTPRFIVRYRLLQDQIYRLDLAAQDHEEEYKESAEQVEGHGSIEEQNAIAHPETESTETYTEELTHVENPGEELEHNYDANSEQQEEEDVENENSHEATPDAVAAEDLVEGGEESGARQNEVDSSAQGPEEAVESNQATAGTSSLKAETVTTVEPTSSTQDVEGAEEAYDETADDIQNHAGDTEADNSSQLNTPHPELAENEHLEPLPEDPDTSGNAETSAHVADDPANTDGNSDENYTEHGNDDESYAENTDEWDDDTFDDDGGLNATFEEGAEEELVAGESTNILSSKSSKRSIDEVEAEGADQVFLSPSSPGLKRPRVD